MAGTLDVVERPNRAPDLTLPDTIRFTEDVDQRWLIPGSDLDGDALDYRLDLNPEWLHLSGDELVGLAGDEDVGHYDIVIRASDGFVEAVDTLVASVVNVGPDVVTADHRIRIGKRLEFAVAVLNLDGGHIEFRGVEGMVFEDHIVGWIPNVPGRYRLEVTAFDPHGLSGKGDVWIQVDPRPQVAIAEVMADPPKGLLGDTNNDGIRESGGDEYVEIVNEGDAPVAIGGWSLGDDDVKGDGTFRFPEGTFLGPRERLVLFGRPPVHALPFVSFGDDGKIGNGLGNRSERILLIDPSCHDTIDVFAYTLARSPGVALVRTEDGIVAHNSFPRNQTHSPGYPAATMVALVIVVPEQMTLGERRAVLARALYSNGDLETIDDGVEWGSGSSLRVDDSILQAVNLGTVEIFAIWQGYLASETVSVVPPVLPPMQLETEPPERARVGAVYRYTPAIRYGEGVEARFTVNGQSVEQNGGEFRWRPTTTGPASMSIFAVRSDGDTLRFTTTRDVEPRPTLVLQEILADPPAGPEGDANKDGVRQTLGDEFVEIANRSGYPVRTVGWVVKDDDVLLSGSESVPDTILESGALLVLFGSDQVSGRLGNGLSNAGDRILLIDTTFGDTLIDETYRVDGDLNRSIVSTADGWIPHEGNRFSPGWIETPTDGGDGMTEDPVAGTSPMGKRAVLRIEEVLSDPPLGLAGDANGDGIRHGFEDEFIELVNAAEDTADLGGCLLGDDDGVPDRLFRLPIGTRLAPGQRLVLFGGGPETTTISNALVFVDDGKIGDGLANAGDRVLALTPDGKDTLSQASFGASDGRGSWVFSSQALPRSHNRLPYSGPYSPGVASPTLFDIVVDAKDARPLEILNLSVVGVFSDGTRLDVKEQVEISFHPENIVSPVSSRFRTLHSGEVEIRARWRDLVGVGVAIIREAETGVAELNTAPTIRAAIDSVAVVGKSYNQMLSVHDSDGDEVSIRLLSSPSWLSLYDDTLTGTPPGEGVWNVRIQLSDTHHEVDRALTLRAVDPASSLKSLKAAAVGLTWTHSLGLPEGFEVQIDRGPVYHAALDEIVWVPGEEDLGLNQIEAVIGRESSGFTRVGFRIDVRSKPHVRVIEILADPASDTNGDGIVDPDEDEYVVIRNEGDRPLDLSGWWLGDDDGEPTILPAGTVLPPGERLVLVGSAGPSTPLAVGARGRIGNGLAGSDRLLLIHPDGPDTVLNVVYLNGNVGEAVVPVAETEAWVPRSSQDIAQVDEIALDEPGRLPDRPHPNPFGSCIKIPIGSGPGRLSILNLLGQPITKIPINGPAVYEWCPGKDEGVEMARGVYLLRLELHGEIRDSKVLYLK